MKVLVTPAEAGVSWARTNTARPEIAAFAGMTGCFGTPACAGVGA
jgi:hypothetical protein